MKAALTLLSFFTELYWAMDILEKRINYQVDEKQFVLTGDTDCKSLDNCPGIGHFEKPSGCYNKDNVFYDCDLILYWKFVPESDLINFALKGRFRWSQWYAVGFGKTRSMAETDVILITIINDPVISDGYAYNYTGIAIDKRDDITIKKHVGKGKEISLFYFARKRDTNDDEHDVAFTNSSCLHIKLAQGSIGLFNQRLYKHTETPLVSEKLCVGPRKRVNISFVLHLTNLIFKPSLGDPHSRDHQAFKKTIEYSIRKTFDKIFASLHDTTVEIAKVRSGNGVTLDVRCTSMCDFRFENQKNHFEKFALKKFRNYVRKNSLFETSYQVVVEEHDESFSFKNRPFLFIFFLLVNVIFSVVALHHINVYIKLKYHSRDIDKQLHELQIHLRKSKELTLSSGASAPLLDGFTKNSKKFNKKKKLEYIREYDMKSVDRMKQLAHFSLPQIFRPSSVTSTPDDTEIINDSIEENDKEKFDDPTV